MCFFYVAVMHDLHNEWTCSWTEAVWINLKIQWKPQLPMEVHISQDQAGYHQEVMTQPKTQKLNYYMNQESIN